MRYILLALLLAFLVIGYSSAQNTDDFGMWMIGWRIGQGVTCDNGWICI